MINAANQYYMPSPRGWAFSFKNSIQIGGELMKKIVAVALACAGAFLICAGLKAAGKEG